MTTFVLLPGMDGTGELFDPLVAALAEVSAQSTTHVVRYPVDRVLGYDELVALVRDDLPPNDPFVLVAESFSGPIGIRIAADPPPNLVGLVLVATFASCPRPMASRLSALVSVAPISTVPTVLAAPFLFGRWSTPALREAFSRALGRVAPRVIRERVRAVLSVDVRDALARVELPVMLLQARRDRLVPGDSATDIVRVRPSTSLVPMVAPHLLLQAIPNDAARVLADFADSLGRPRRNAAPDPELVGIDHIYVSVRDFDASERFYDLAMHALGFRKNEFVLSGDRHVQFYNRHFGVVIRPAREGTAPHDPCAPGLHHLCFRVESVGDLATIAARLRDAGVVVDGPHHRPEYAPDYHALFLCDPDGIRLEITNYRAERRARHDRWDELA